MTPLDIATVGKRMEIAEMLRRRREARGRDS